MASQLPKWNCACPDWERRIIESRPLVPFPPLFQDQADKALAIFNQLVLSDVTGSPTMGDVSREWALDFVSAIFGSYDAESGRRLIKEFLLSISKKNTKALALDTPIPTPAGWTTMAELQPGDTVFGANGKPCKVVGVSDVFYDHDCFHVCFSNGESVIADAGHLWVTKSLKDAKTKVRTTGEIAFTVSTRRDGARNHTVQMPLPIQCCGANLPLSPYAFGAWLGDGHSASGRITFSREDREIFDSIVADGWQLRRMCDKGNASTYAISDGNRSQAARNKSFAAVLRRMGVLNNKHIPNEYLRASLPDRLALLQGLMDTDGCINKNGRVLTYCSTSRRLAYDVAELLSTFGIKFTIRENALVCNGRNVPGTGYVLQFMAFSDDIKPFRLSRKLRRMRRKTKRSARSRSVQIVSADPVKPVPVKCIAVDSDDHQFLFGTTMLPTHNSTLAAGIMLTSLVLNWRKSGEFLILAPTIEVANNSFIPMRDMIKEDAELSDMMHVQEHYRTITHRVTNATVKVVAADNEAVSGKKGIGVLIDELWMFGKRAGSENMFREATGGLASRPEGFVIYLTTESDEAPAGVHKQKMDYGRGVRDGRIVDNRFLPVIYEFPKFMIEDGSCRDMSNAYMTNPNLGLSVDVEFIERGYAQAMENGEASVRGFLAKHLNIPIGMALHERTWAGSAFWERSGRKDITLKTLCERSEVITIGIDGGGLDDMLALSMIGRESGTGNWLHWAHAWLHPIALQRRKENKERYADFEKAGDLTIVTNIGDDVEQLAEFVFMVFQTGLLERIGVDQAAIDSVIEAIQKKKVTPQVDDKDRFIAIPQGWKMMSSIINTERKLAEGKFLHGASSMMAWCVSNAKVEARGNAILITKEVAGSGKIDPLMATFNAGALMSLNPAPRKKKYSCVWI